MRDTSIEVAEMSGQHTASRSARVIALTTTLVVLGAFTALVGLLLFIGLWGLMAGDGEADPAWSWLSYLLMMAAIAIAFLAAGGLTVLVYRFRQRLVSTPSPRS